MSLISDYINQVDWRVRENANKAYSFASLLNHISGAEIAKYTLDSVYTAPIRDAHNEGWFHIHDLNAGIVGYCAGYNIEDLLIKGFKAQHGRASAGPAKHLSSALLQMTNFIGTLQTEWAGAQAFNSIDTYLAPFIAIDALSYQDVKQLLQQFVFGLNIASRWGECVTEDTECKTPRGWKKYTQLKVGDPILTFNLTHKRIEQKALLKINVFDCDKEIYVFEGDLYYTEVTKGHNCVVFDNKTQTYVLMSADEIYNSNRPITVPVYTRTNIYHTTITKKEIVHYTGKVWCPSTENGTFIASTEGCDYITGNSPFSNVTLDLTIPKDLAERPVIIGGVARPDVGKYGDFQRHANMFNTALIEIMSEGDYQGTIFTFPIITLNVTKDFNWNSDIATIIGAATAKYGLFYFQNYIGSGNDPGALRSFCCRLTLDLKELETMGNGFSAGASTGSIGNVTLNLPMLACAALKNKETFFELLDHYLDLAVESLVIKRKVISENLDRGLMAYTAFYLPRKFAFHFSTIGVVGGHEMCENLLGVGIDTKEGKQFAITVLNFIRNYMKARQKEFKYPFNLEASPAEGSSHRLAKRLLEKFPEAYVSGETSPYLTNSTNLPVGATEELHVALEHQNDILGLYTGGSTFHVYLGESPEPEAAMNLVKNICENYKIPYFSITPTFCYDKETEVLTMAGWKYFSALVPSDLIITMNSDNETFKFSVPTHILQFFYAGEMYHFKTDQIDIKVTPNHRMLVKRNDQYLVVEAHEVLLTDKMIILGCSSNDLTNTLRNFTGLAVDVKVTVKTQDLDEKSISIIKETGTVYCVSMPASNMIIVRRKGAAIISGNSICPDHGYIKGRHETCPVWR